MQPRRLPASEFRNSQLCMALLKHNLIPIDVGRCDKVWHSVGGSTFLKVGGAHHADAAEFSSCVRCAKKKLVQSSSSDPAPGQPVKSESDQNGSAGKQSSSTFTGATGSDNLKFVDIVAAQARDVSRISYEGTPHDRDMEVALDRSRASCEGGDDSARKKKSSAESKSLDPDGQWQNVFPAYMQSKPEDSEDEVLQPNGYANGNGKPRAVVNGVAAKKAAAAATASAKALESHVTTSPSVSTPPCSSAKPPTEGQKLTDLISHDPIWAAIRAEARLEAEREPLLSSFLYASILAHPCFERSLGFILANRLKNATLLATQLMDVFDDVFSYDEHLQQAIRLDVQALKDRDPSCRSYSSAVLYLKGYHSLQAYRVAHVLWNRGQQVFALALQSRISEVFAVDIHPAARIGKAILLDHGTGVVIGETAVIGNRVSLMQGVTLGGTGKDSGDRHPKIREGVLIGAGATILGNIVVGKGAMIAAGSLVLKDVPPHSMVAGTPAKVIGILEEPTPALTMQHDVTREFCLDLEAAVRRQLVQEHELFGGAGI